MKKFKVDVDPNLTDNKLQFPIIVEASSSWQAIMDVALKHNLNQCLLKAEEI